MCGAAVRAISGRTNAHFRKGRLYLDDSLVPVLAPHLRLDPDNQTFKDFRAVADGLALRLLACDPTIYEQACPQDETARLLYDFFEQVRLEATVASDWPGVRANVQTRFRAWAEAFEHSALIESSQGILLFTVMLTVWSRVTGGVLSEAQQDLLEATRAGMAGEIGEELYALRRLRNDQAAYAAMAARLAEKVSLNLAAEMALDRRPKDSDKNSRSLFSLLLTPDAQPEDGFDVAPFGQSRVFDQHQASYRVFTRRYDRIELAASRVRRAELKQFRQQMDEDRASLSIGVAQLARLFRRIFRMPQDDGWIFGQEEGILDGRTLSQLIASPAETRIFRQDQVIERVDQAVTVLLDCSGSMRTHARRLSVLLDTLLRALGMAGAKTELLGFTTGAWNGGRAMKDWQRQGKPAHPGRLNELCHLLFKQADTSWSRARLDIAALLKHDLYREGVDGEAVLWASQRLQEQPVRRRTLIVVSDGCPMDSATQYVNDDYYLASHLQQVVRQSISQGIDVVGLGVGLDLSSYYPRSLAVDLQQALTPAVFYDIARLLAGGHRR
nr:cobalt chelatase [Advenella sp. FME57]